MRAIQRNARTVQGLSSISIGIISFVLGLVQRHSMVVDVSTLKSLGSKEESLLRHMLWPIE